MEDIEYLDEYKDLVLPGMKIGDVRASSAAAPASSSGAPRRRRISSDSSNSSSIDADIFQKLFHGKIIDDELFNESEVKPKGRHPLTSSSSDDSNDALDALFNTRRGVKAKPHKRRERYESFDSGDDLGETLMRNSHRPTVLSKPSTSQAGAGFGSHQLSKATGAASTSKSHSGGASSSKSAAGTSKFGAKGSSSVGKQSDPVNGNGSGQHKSVTIIKATKTDLRPPKHEPKTDPLNLREFYEESDSDSSYEYESDFYGDGDSEDEDAEPVIDISTDTSRTTSVADTVTPVVSDDEGLEQLSGPSELNKLKEREPMLSCANERLLSYLNNLSCAEAPPIYKKQNSARKPRSNEKKPSSSTEQVKHAIEQPAASGKEEKEPEPSTSAPNSSSANRKLYDIDESLTLETLERMSLDLAEQIMEIDVERSYEFEKRSGSKPRSSSKSKQSADPSSNLSQSHVRKLTYSSEQLDNCESERQQLRRAKSESTFSKQKRGKGQKRSKNRAATTEEKVGTPQTGETTVVKRKRGRPRKHFPKEPEVSVSASENKKDLEEAEEPSTIIDTKETEGPKDTAEESKEEVEPKPEKVEEELDNAKELTEFTTSSQKDINMTVAEDLKSALNEDLVEPDIESAESTENGPHPARNTPTESLDEVNSNDSELNQTVTDAPEIKDKEILSKNDEPAVEMEAQEDPPKEDDVGEPSSIEDSSKNCNDVEMSVVLGDAMDVSANLEVAEETQNMQEVSDSQLAEDIKLAEEILAAEVGKGVEVTEATGTSVQGQEDPVTEIVKELELETISEVVEKSEEQTALAEQTPLNEESPYEVNPPVSEEEPLTEESPLVGEAPLAPGELIPKLDTQTPLSPAVTPKKSEETASGESSVARRTLRSDRPRSSPLQDSTPVKEHESRSKRPIRSDISSILEEPSRRNSPRLGRSPAESQDRSPAERKATPSKMAGEKSAKKTKRGVDSTPASKNKTDQINAKKEDENTLEDEKPNPSETETEKPEKGKSLKPRKSCSSQRPLSSKSPKPDGENVPSSDTEKVMEDSKAEETQSSESEKPEKGKALKSRTSYSSQGPLSSKTPNPDGENVPLDTEKVMDGEEVSNAEDALGNDTQSSVSKKPEKSKSLKPRKSRSSQRPLSSKSPKPEGENIPSGTEKVTDDEKVYKSEESIDKDIQSSNKTVEETPESLEEKPVKRSKSRKGRKKETKVLSDQQTVGDASENPEGKEATRLTPSIPDDNTPKENNLETKNIEEIPESKMEAPAKKPGRKTPSSKLTSERSKNLSRSSNRDSDVPSDKEEKVTGRLSRRDKALLENSETPKPSPSSRKKKKPKEEAVDESKEKSKERQKGNHKEKSDSDKKTKVSLDKTEPQPEKLMSNETKMEEIQDCKVKSEDEVPSSAKESIEGEASDVQPENTLHDKVNLATDATEVSTSNEEPESAKAALDSKETSSQKVSNKPKKTASRVFGKIRKRRQAVTASPKDRDNNDPVPISTPIESDIPPTETEPKSLFSDRKIPTKTYLKQDRKKTHSPSSTPSPRKPAKDGDPKDTDSTQVTFETPAEVSEISPKTGQTTPQKSEKPRTSSKTKPASIAKSIQDTPSCRKLRILIKRTPTTKYQKARKSPIIRKTPTKSKRFKKVLQKIEEVPVPIPEEQTEPPVPVPKPEEQTLPPVPVPQPEEQTENSPESGPEGTDTPPKASENEEPPLIQPSETTESETNSSESQSGTNDEIQEEPKTTLATEEETIPKSDQETSPTDASSPRTVSDVVEEKPSSADPGPELKETQDEESEPVKPEEALTEASENSAPEEISPLESDAPTSPITQSITETETLTEEALEDAPITSTTDSTEITHAPADLPDESAVVTPDPESMETRDDTLDQDSMEGTEETPIPESAETTGVTVESESEASTSSTVKRSLRKREADPSLPDEAAKRKQQQLREKSFGQKKEAIKTDRRRNQVDTEDRPAVKRNRVDAEEKEKFISYIGQDTILSSVKKTKSEPVKTPLSARKTPGAAGKKSLDKPHVSANPAGKKPLVQTLLSSSLNLRKPTPADTPPSGRKSLGKVESPASESEEMTNLGSSVVVTKKSLPSSKKYETSKDDVASPGVRKVNISVSVVKSKETPAESPSPSLVVTQTSPVVEAPKTTRKSEVKTKDTLISAPGKSKASQIDPLKAKPSRKGDQELSKKSDPLALTTPKVPHQAGVAKKVEARKTFGGAEALARKSLSAGEISRKSEARKSEGGTLTSRKAISQSELSKKAEARKSGGATPKELLETPQKVEAKKPEELPTEASTETLKNMEPEEVVKTATKVTKKTLAERKSELVGSKQGPDTIAASTSRDSSREDSVRATRSEKNATSARPRALPAIRQPGHVTRATSTNRSLAATPSSEIEGPMIRGRRRGRGGRGRRMPAQKRKADEPEEASEPKRSKETLPQEVQQEATKDVAFPVKITAANLSKSTERSIETQPAKPEPKKAKKLCVKINRRAVNKWLEQHEKPLQQSLKKGATSMAVEPPKDATVTSEVNPKAKSNVVQPKDALNADSKSQPSDSTISSDPLQNEKAKEQLPAATVPPVPSHVAKEPDSQLTTSLAPVPAPVPAPQPTASAPKAASQPVPEKSIPKDTAQRKAPVPTKTMPLPVPIMEVKDEPEDIPAEPIDQDVAPMPEPVAAPPAIPTVPVPPTINGRPVISMGYPSAAPRAPSSIPSASAASSANPNAIGQTKMFSFLYPNRYQPSYGKVGLDFCCPNLDGPMRAIDPTRLHAKAEVPVLEVPQFLVITTKFISKADKNIPHKVRAKLEMLGKDKELDTSVGMDSSILTDTDTTQPVISPPEATLVTVAPPPIPPHGLQINPPMPVGSITSIHIPPSEPAPYLASAQDTALPDSLDLLTKQLPKGTTLVKKIVPPGTTIPSASTSLAAALSATSTPAPSAQSPPALIQLPPIFPTDKHRVELQTRVQMFDMVLQTLSRRVANLTLAERQRTIEEIVKTSTLMPIDVDVGTKLLENYVHYLNIATNTQTQLPTVRTSEVVPMPKAPDVVEPVPVPPLLRMGGKTTSAPAPSPSPSKRKPSQKEATTTNVPLYDSDKNIIGFRKVTNFDSASTSSPAGTCRKGAASSGSKATPKTVARKSSGGTVSQASNAKTTTAATGSATRTTNPGTKKKSLTGGTIIAINHPEPPAKMAKTTPGRTVAQSKKPAGSPKPGTAGGRTTNPKPNVLIINQLAQPEECILPDSNNTAEPMETEIKGEVEDPAEVVL
ncbi:microtubule-associated protein futsch isoform X2 [Drosophila bipectinata]|uniref:microtubule-associated protein futsch isoform X2 n=1 Tax=Drosophila bipectinata TaxID=42026 RepID=UPI001C8931BD|nr:titin [Drosophila bipectinata]